MSAPTVEITPPPLLRLVEAGRQSAVRETSGPIGLPAKSRRVHAGALEFLGEMRGLTVMNAIWMPSGPCSDTTFERWVSAPRETPTPDLASGTTTMSCWEAVMLAAYRAGHVSWQWMHDIYVSPARGWENLLEQRLAPRGLHDFDLRNPAENRPIPGDVVIWDHDLAHVAVAAGQLDPAGNDLIYSFSAPPPDPADFYPPTRVEVTTVQEINPRMRDEFGCQPVIRFGAGPWSGSPEPALV